MFNNRVDPVWLSIIAFWNMKPQNDKMNEDEIHVSSKEQEFDFSNKNNSPIHTIQEEYKRPDHNINQLSIKLSKDKSKT